LAREFRVRLSLLPVDLIRQGAGFIFAVKYALKSIAQHVYRIIINHTIDQYQSILVEQIFFGIL